VNKERATLAFCFIIHVIVVIIGRDKENENKKINKKSNLKKSPGRKSNEANPRRTSTNAGFNNLETRTYLVTFGLKSGNEHETISIPSPLEPSLAHPSLTL